MQVRELNLLSLALSDDMERGLRGAEEGLQAVSEELRSGILPTQGAAAEQALRTRAALIPLVSRLWLVDRQGHVLAASHPDPAPPLSSFGARLEAVPAGRMALGSPQPQSPDMELALAVPFPATGSGPGGWVLAGVPPHALLGGFGLIGAAADTTSMAVYGPDDARLDGEDRPPAAAPETARATGRGDGKLTAMHVGPRYGLKMRADRELNVALRSWRETAEAAAAVLLLLLGILAAAVHFALLAAHRRHEAQRLAEAQFTRASRLEALGTLAGGVAHDFNNVLAAVVGYGEMARDEASDGSDQARYIDHVLQAATRGKAMVERILGVNRIGSRPSVVFEVEPVVEEVLTLLSASLRPGVVLERALEAPGARLRGDPTRMFEAVMNLCNNAMQSMPGGGMLTIRTRRVHAEAPKILSHSTLAPGQYIALAVRDQGTGITPEVVEHLFEPFFTTRLEQSGTGLGLAVVHGVMSEFRGAIDVSTTPGEGSRFTLYFPETQEAPTALDGARDPRTSEFGSGQRLLVVDDDAELVALAQEMLKSLGYEPRGETDPRRALELLRSQPHAYAALITDEKMQGLRGTQLIRAVRQFAPNLPILLVSGYGGASLLDLAARAGVSRVLSKPLQRASLGRALAEELQ